MKYTPTLLSQKFLPTTEAQVAEWRFPSPMDVSVCEDRHMIELSLPPLAAGGSARFPDHAPDLVAPIGAVVMRPAGVMIRVLSNGGHIQVARIMVRPEDYTALAERELSFDEKTLGTALNLQDHLVRSLLIRLRQELLSPGFGSSALLDAYATALVIETARCLNGPLGPASGGGLVPWQEKRVRERLAESGPPPRVTELANLCGVSVRHFARLYKAATGEPVTDTITRLQIDRAEQSLSSSDLPIKLIAAHLGFQGANAFGIAFKRATGLTPSLYRQRHRKKMDLYVGRSSSSNPPPVVGSAVIASEHPPASRLRKPTASG